ncbi:MAG TPA: Sec-independent protein translocase subunit TatA [Segeticoccus sp.]|jgi:sec-independent protein translocase protein TatA|nr:Sec-independent protein translocase subunit TatA [Segeticoccus sp.]
MGWRGLFEGWHIVLLIIVVIVVFGWKKLPDAARSMGRSMRIFKSEMGEMKNDGKSAASRDTVRGDVIHDPQQGSGTRTNTGASAGSSTSDTGARRADSSAEQGGEAAAEGDQAWQGGETRADGDRQHQPHGQQHGA